ncbi:MAG TPA: SGNH/GDSL hydrolase family protein [Pyrinomonadaceae bacterium]|nr:SGNH/GDSL hydrolase family protein [Pyrinomonadaceae bacterium]
MSLRRWQTIYVAVAAVVLPVSPILYLQGQYTRWKVGLLPDAGGEKSGLVGDDDLPARLLVIGESTVAGLGARTHETALAGQFAKQLSARIDRPVSWTVIGRNGVTAGRTIEELVPQIPDQTFDFILVGLGGNDVMKLSSPRKWRSDMLRLLGILRERNPDSPIFITNCPMIKSSPVIPHPIKFLLWELSKLHDANIKDFTAGMDRVCYYHQPKDFRVDGFFADGIHPSEQGYADWSAAMMKFFDENYNWQNPKIWPKA